MQAQAPTQAHGMDQGQGQGCEGLGGGESQG